MICFITTPLCPVSYKKHVRKFRVSRPYNLMELHGFNGRIFVHFSYQDSEELSVFSPDLVPHTHLLGLITTLLKTARFTQHAFIVLTL
jgi:hypothetical protein